MPAELQSTANLSRSLLVNRHLPSCGRASTYSSSAASRSVRLSSSLRGFVDEVAVRTATTLPWSNGQTEGQMTKFKLVLIGAIRNPTESASEPSLGAD
jgi:transposase